MLAAIFAETIKVDSSVTKERVDPTNPASKIIGLTIMIDHFAEMLAGVNEFHPTTRGAQAGEPRNLAEVVEKYFAIHSIIKNERRPSSLELCVSFDRGLYILSHADIFEYIISVLLDNAWKYSLDGTTVTVSVPSQDGNLGVITFTNISKPLPADLDLFTKGTQAIQSSDGFGYGLFWAQILVDHYSGLARSSAAKLELIHEEKVQDNQIAEQTFVLSDVPLARK